MAVEKNGKEPSVDKELVEVIDEISISMSMLDKKLYRSSHSIFKVPYQLSQVNEGAYEPRVISIGPYHQGRPHLKAMEIHKLTNLKMLLARRKEDSLARYVEAMKNLEEDARSCYADSINCTSQEFVRMLVVDGFFIIELIRKYSCDELKDENDYLFKLNFDVKTVRQELLLVENQLPIFVLEKLFNMTKAKNEDETFIQMAVRFFSGAVPGPTIGVGHHKKKRHFIHLLGLVYDYWLPSEVAIKRYKQPAMDLKWNFIHSARELFESGIKFKKVTGESNSLFEIKFEKGRLQIPTLTIYHGTERIFRNFIAYEQFNDGPSYVMDYTRFMDCLINYGEDVALLSRCGIIENWLGSNEKVANMFNELNNFVYLPSTNFYYTEIFNDVNNYCRRPWTLWKVKLRSKSFNTPWDWVLTSIVAGTILLLLTVVQTILAILSYKKQGN